MSEDKSPRTINEYQKLLKLKDQIIDGLEDRYEGEKKINEIAIERIKELNDKLEEKQKLETVRDINYWRGIEKVYEEKLNEYLERISLLEKRNLLLELENDELKERCNCLYNT